MNNKNKLALAALSGLFAVGVMTSPVLAADQSSKDGIGTYKVADAAKEKHACKGMNSCKGQGADGKNDCKGKGSCRTDGQ